MLKKSFCIDTQIFFKMNNCEKKKRNKTMLFKEIYKNWKGNNKTGGNRNVCEKNEKENHIIKNPGCAQIRLG